MPAASRRIAHLMPLAILLFALSWTASFSVPYALANPNETPKKKNAVIFGPHPSAQTIDKEIELYLCAENYSVTKHVWGRGGAAATLAQLKAIATGGFAVLAIIAHGSTTFLSVEDFETADAARAKYNAYRADANYANIKDDLDWGELEDPGPGQKRYAVGLSAAGVNKLFGGADANRSIVAVFACNSTGFQANNPKPFGATEYLGFAGALDNKTRSKGARGFFVMGGPEGIPKRPVKPAFEKKMDHVGPGNTTLAPACTGHEPPKDALLPLNVKTDGKTTYDTKMKTTIPAIMELSGCEAVLSDEAWFNACEHRFKVEPKKPGRLILKVKPTQAVSENNSNWLIGNLYRMPKNFDEELDPNGRPTVDRCQFGQSGLDGLKPCVPPENPFRWCVWCGEIPTDPGIPSQPSQTPKSMDDHNFVPRQVPYGERDAFVLFQDAPGPNTILQPIGPLPPNMTFQQVGSWYAHVIFAPSAGQVGQLYQVDFESRDDNGFRGNTIIAWQVEPRLNEISVFVSGESNENPLGDEIVRPGNPGEFLFRLANSGNTFLQNLALFPLGGGGADTIPPSAMTLTPQFIPQLGPEESVEVAMQVHTTPAQPTGAYVGRVNVSAQSADGSVHVQPTFGLHVDRPPTIFASLDTIRVDVNATLSVPFQVDDPDLETVQVAIDYAAFGATLTPGSSPSLASANWYFEWTPPVEAAGVRVFPIVATDGFDRAVHELVVEVLPVVHVAEPPLRFSFNAHPNPATGQIEFSLNLPGNEEVEISVYDTHGRLVGRPFPRAWLGAGPLAWTWHPESLTSGVYFVRVRAGEIQIDRRVVWLAP
jgi:hypothetical protein